VGVEWGNSLGSSGDDDSIKDLVVRSIILNAINSVVFTFTFTFTRSIDGDFDGDGATTDLLALESVDGLLLFIFVTNVDKAISFALSRLAPPPSNDTSRVDIEAGIGEESGEAGVIDIEAEVGNKENGLGGFADRVLTGGTVGTRSPGFALPGLGSILCGPISYGGLCGGSEGLSFARPGLVTALRARSRLRGRDESKGAYVGLLLFLLGLLRSLGSRRGLGLFDCLTIRLSVGDFSGDRLGTSSAPGPLLGLLRPGFLVLLFCWFGDLDDDQTTIELLLVQSLDGRLGGHDGGESNETVTSRAAAVARPALDNLSADAAD